jgi:hypothetical protein
MSALDSATAAYVRCVKEFVDKVRVAPSSASSSLSIESFRETVRSEGMDRRDDIHRCWNIIQGMLQPLEGGSTAEIERDRFSVSKYGNDYAKRYKSLMKQHVVNAKRLLQSRWAIL